MVPRYCVIVVPLPNGGEPRMVVSLSRDDAATLTRLGWHDEWKTLVETARSHFDACDYAAARRWAAAANALAEACVTA